MHEYEEHSIKNTKLCQYNAACACAMMELLKYAQLCVQSILIFMIGGQFTDFIFYLFCQPVSLLVDPLITRFLETFSDKPDYF